MGIDLAVPDQVLDSHCPIRLCFNMGNFFQGCEFILDYNSATLSQISGLIFSQVFPSAAKHERLLKYCYKSLLAFPSCLHLVID